jgi:hypothetical protein
VDLPAAPVNPADFARAVTAYLLTDEAADAVLLVIHTRHSATAGHLQILRDYDRAVETDIEQAGLKLRDGWIVTGEGWRNYFCTDPGCCTLHPLSEIRDSARNAHLIYRGSAPSDDPAIKPAFTGGAGAHAKISTAAAGHQVANPLDATAPAMRRARTRWLERLGGDVDEDTACQLAALLHVKALRDRIMADTITPAEDPDTYAQVLTGYWDGQPDRSRVEDTETVLIRLLGFTPTADRAPLLSFLGWLAWYKGRSSTAHRYFDKALAADPDHRLAHLMRELINRGALPTASTTARTSYGHHHRNRQ